MKHADLEKLKGVKIDDRMGRAATSGRFGRGSADIPNRREQRRLDQAQGLVPFAVKLNGELVKQIQALALQRQANLNDVVAELLKKGLAG